jgi:hypothetical protein
MRLDFFAGMTVSNAVAIAIIICRGQTLCLYAMVFYNRQHCWRSQPASLKFIDSGFALERCIDGVEVQFRADEGSIQLPLQVFEWSAIAAIGSHAWR